MRLTQTLLGPPVFHFWKHFGAGRKRRYPYFKMWRSNWRAEIARKKVADYTLATDQLPPGSRLMQAEDFLDGPVDALPDELIRRKQESVVYDHPWPYNVQLDPTKSQVPMYSYDIHSRFWVPRADCQVLTNTILETDKLNAFPPLEPSAENLETVQRQFDWATSNDSVLVRLPNRREFPKINIRPVANYGLTNERKEFNVMNLLLDYSQTLLAKHYHDSNDSDKLNEILGRRTVAFPHCQVPFERQSHNLNLDLCIDSMSLGRTPLPQINTNPQETRSKEPIQMKPRTWRSLLEKSSQYTPNWSFTLPQNAHLHTILLASRIKRTHRDPDEMLARSMIHAFGLASQYARLRAYEKSLVSNEQQLDEGATSGQRASCILQDPLCVGQINDADLLEKPLVLQTIGYDLEAGNFYFMRYQLNSVKFDDDNASRVKNQAWHSGPISGLDQALRYYLDFQAFDSNVAKRMLSDVETQRQLDQQQQQQRQLELEAAGA